MKCVGKQYSRGQASMEYVVVCAALAIALGIAMANQDWPMHSGPPFANSATPYLFQTDHENQLPIAAQH